MELNPPVLIGWLDVDLLERLGAAAALGLLLGLDGELRRHAAGLIVFSKGQPTTAVHLWMIALVGIVCSAALWPLLAAGAVISLAVLTPLVLVESKLFSVTRAEEE